ncbi:hypothetical protein F4821DRAFT_232332 [Hypoxylon rubiginosum]|uniref:Uncharacterized protein n=1 Tax=Hypoxylon rubiginosum TaxID=110542 RepID=A0ACC0D9F5_9PEZI|nr:hypothetical protein F4821DRAFT_232332 [Hypoxylon rubiginosum]
MWLLGRLVGFVFRKIRMGYIISSRHPNIPERPNLFLYGCGAGMIGLAAMTASEILEQLLTRNPVPGNPGARARLYGDRRRRVANMAMRYGNRVLAAILRAWMSYHGVRGLLGDFVFVGAWLLVDQTRKNRTGVPWIWPVNEQIVEILHKTVFALVTGYFTDRWIQ